MSTTKRRVLPPVKVHGGPGSIVAPDYFACCTEGVWVEQPGGEWDMVSCDWYGPYRDTQEGAKADAARHRRAHRADARYRLSSG